MIENYLGNMELLKLHKTAFVCSRKIPAGIVLKSYDWAIAQREAGNCIMSGFQSPIEKDVFYFLMKGNQPIILVLARGMISGIPLKIQKAIEDERLLIISPFKEDVKRVTQETATLRNILMIELADEIFFPFISPGGSLDKLITQIPDKRIKIGFD
jgi:hypothetical protein